MNIDDMRRITEIAQIEGSGLSDTLSLLISLSNSAYVSEELLKAIKQELKAQLKWFDDNMKIVTVENTITHRHRELVDK